MLASEKMEGSPKRIILRLRVNEFDSSSPTDFDRVVIAYLESAGRRPEELAERLHQSHVEPFQAPEMNQKSFHIILDQDKDMLIDPDLETVEHEVYRVRRAQNDSL